MGGNEQLNNGGAQKGRVFQTVIFDLVPKDKNMMCLTMLHLHWIVLW